MFTITQPINLNIADKIAHTRAHHAPMYEGFAINMPFVALEAATSERGERMAATTGAMADAVTYPLYAAAITAAVACIPGVNLLAAEWIGFAGAIFPSSITNSGAAFAIRKITEQGRRVGRLQMGGKYIDTSMADNLRANAVAELTYAAQPARRYLGQEAMFMDALHRRR